MRKKPEIASTSTGTSTVLSVGPLIEDHSSLQAIMRHSTFRLLTAHNRVAALPLLEQHEIAVVLYDADVQRGTWIDMLEAIRDLTHPPSLIVKSRLADER